MVNKSNSDDLVDKAIKPLLDKLLTTLPATAGGVIQTNDADGLHLRFKHRDDYYKVLSSAYNTTSNTTHLNIIKVASALTTCRECERIDDICVDGSSDLKAAYMNEYQWAASLVKGIIDGEQ